MFNPARLTLARERRKLTKKALAEALKVDQKTVIRWESGEVEPPPSIIDRMVLILAFPREFFFGPDVDQPLSDAVSFRSLSTMPARDRDAALAASSLAFVLGDWVEERFSLPAPDLLDCDMSAAEMASRLLRQKWGLGERPIKNMVHMLEAKGVRVFSLAEKSRHMDAFSMWRRDVPYVFLNTMKTAERSRYDAAHELGHLCMHRHGGPQGGRAAEEQANSFASAFLMPKAEVLAKLPRIQTLNQIVEAKKYWRVSVSALNYRLHKLGITSEWQYRSFCIQISDRFGQSEPYTIPRERSVIWEKVLGALRGEGFTKHKLAAAVALPVAEIENLVFQLTNMQSIEGHGAGSAKGRAKLAVVGGAAS